MRAIHFIIPALALAGCKSDYAVIGREAGALELEVTSPTYGDFMGDEDITVTGRAAPAWATVLVEGEAVDLEEDGTFSVVLPVGYEYRIVDVEASFGGESKRERIPVFDGNDPAETWPGAATARFLPAGLDRLGEGLGAYIDALGWEAAINDVLPEYTGDGFSLTPLGLSHEPTIVALNPDTNGIETGIYMEDLKLEYELTVDLGWYSVTETISMGFAEVYIGALAVPELDDDGIITLTLTDATLDLGDAEFEFGFLEGWVIEWITDALFDWVVEPLTDLLLTFILDSVGTIELGGPFEFELDLLGTPLSAGLSDLFTDTEGLGAGLGIGIGEPASMDKPSIPTPDSTLPGAADAHAAGAVHEGLFQVLIKDAVLGMLKQDLQLGSPYGDLIGAGIVGLPGGDEAPEGDGWCLAIDPGTAYVVRMHESIAPIATAYIPDFKLDVGVMDGNGGCEDWLSTSLALELGIMIENGAEIGFDINIAEGAVLEYGASEYDEAEVVAALSDWFGGLAPTLLSLLGGSLDLDLNSFLGDFSSDPTFGALLGDLYISIEDSQKLYNDDGTWTEGLYAVTLKLWD